MFVQYYYLTTEQQVNIHKR